MPASQSSFSRSAWILLVAIHSLGCDGSGRSDAGTRDANADECAPGDCTFDPFALLVDPYLPARLLPGRARLASSRQPEPADGMGNTDFNNFVRVEPDGRRLLLEADGPGVITRIWFTGRQPVGQVYEVLDETVLHIEIDGTEVVFVDGASGVSLETLTSGILPSFPRPWVAGRDTASNAFLVHIPIAFADSIRMWIDEPPGHDTMVFYQIDWRELPRGYIVDSFVGALDAGRIAHLDTATQLWIERSTLLPTEAASETLTVPPGETAVVVVNRATTVRGVRVELIDGSISALESELLVDDVSVVRAPLARWTFASSPAKPHDSALATVDAESVTFRYPFPVYRAAELRLTNTGPRTARAAVLIEHDPGVPDIDLGALRASCGSILTPADGANTTLLEIVGSRGQYAGQFLNIRSAQPGFFSGLWVLEGDHEVEVDSESLLGTGLEDYFGGSFYYLRGEFTLPLSGASYRSELETTSEPEVSQYRHHFLDTVPFARTLRFEYETFLPNSVFEYCTFWYEAGS